MSGCDNVLRVGVVGIQLVKTSCETDKDQLDDLSEGFGFSLMPEVGEHQAGDKRASQHEGVRRWGVEHDRGDTNRVGIETLSNRLRTKSVSKV